MNQLLLFFFKTTWKPPYLSPKALFAIPSPAKDPEALKGP
jgi:hypothetical protein